MSLPSTDPVRRNDLPRFNAIILAGGRSSRLDGTPKALLQVAGGTLLAAALHAAAGAAACAVAGPPSLAGALEKAGHAPLLVREDPPFSGPAAALAAAWTALADWDRAAGRRPPAWTLVLACDMPFISSAVATLLAAARAADSEAASDLQGVDESLLAVDGTGREQPLAALYRTAHLGAAVHQGDRPAGLENLSMRRLLAKVQWRGVAVPAHSTADIDTWADARRWSVETGKTRNQEVSAVSAASAACERTPAEEQEWQARKNNSKRGAAGC